MERSDPTTKGAESERMPAPLNAETAKKIEERKKQYIEELKAQANKELVDFEERPLEKWLKSCEMLRNQMDLAKQDGDSKRHYIFGMRLCNLGAHHLYPIPSVPPWSACVVLRCESRNALQATMPTFS